MVKETAKRAFVVCRELLRFDLESRSGEFVNDQQLDIQMKYLQSRPTHYQRFMRAALIIVHGLDAFEQEVALPVDKPPLSGDALWESIVDASKP